LPPFDHPIVQYHLCFEAYIFNGQSTPKLV
jgi:hypothetical protein